MTDEMLLVCDEEVTNLLAKGVITEITDGSFGILCSLFCVPKKEAGRWRPILNLKLINLFIRYEHFKMENLESVRLLVKEGDWLVKLDLRDAYFTVAVHETQHKFLRFSWRGRIYQYCCMAFGLAPAPRIFTKLMKVVVAFLRKLGIRLVIYLDDLLFMNSTKKGVLADLKVAVDLIESLGFLINWEKSDVIPKRVMEYLGLMVDTKALSFSLPSGKVESVTTLCRKALSADRVSLRNLASIIGNFTWAIPTVPFAQSHYRSLQSFYISESKRASGDLNVKCSLSSYAKQDLKWWV